MPQEKNIPNIFTHRPIRLMPIVVFTHNSKLNLDKWECITKCN